MENLEFHNLEFNEGINVTVRRGEGWATRLAPGDVFFFGQEGCGVEVPPAGVGTCLSAQVYDDLGDIPITLLAYEHDSDCQSRDGLRDELKRIYGSGGLTGSFTVIVFTVEPFRMSVE